MQQKTPDNWALLCIQGYKVARWLSAFVFKASKWAGICGNRVGLMVRSPKNSGKFLKLTPIIRC